jgi:putative membrane-bound dehydrogenase-like protein
MRRLICSLFAVLLVSPLPATVPATRTIFDGNTLTGWEGDPHSWRVEDGAITGEIPAGHSLARNEFIFWEGEVADFDLNLEFRLSGAPSANSGIQYRCTRRADGEPVGYQADLDDGASWLGLIYEENGRAIIAQRGTRVAIAPDGRRWVDTFAQPDEFKSLFKAGEWNTYRITATASHVEIRVNGRLTSVLDDRQNNVAKFSGRIALQLHSGSGPAKIQFRNIRLTDLGSTAFSSAAVSTVPSTEATKASVAGDTNAVAAARDSLRQQASPVLWHLQPNPAKPTAVANSVAQKIVQGMKVTDGFQAELVAAEPDVRQPIAFTFDELGRLWVVEAYSYPTKQPVGQGKDRIIILEDKDGDGFFETRKVFVENLNLVSGIAVGFRGVWVGAAPELLFIPDQNHDDKPDGAPVVLLDGWGYQDTHETLNSFTWGPDGWLYGNEGVFVKSLIGKPGTPAEKRQPMAAGVWRYHPVRHEFEIFARGGSNQWGLDFNENGHLFMAHCRSYYGGGGTSYVIRNGHYWNQANSGFAPFIMNQGPDFAPELKNYLPASARYDSGEGGAGKPGTDAVYGGHAHAGTMVYLGDNWPDIYRNQVFTHNLFGRQLNHQHNEREGSAYETLDAGYDLMYAPDQTFLGVALAYGPDGAAYMTDWSDLQHCHNPREEIWERGTGRIYRLSWAKTWHPVKVDLRSQTDVELVALHDHKNEWFVRTARRVLQERAASRPIDQAAIQSLRVKAANNGDYPTQLRALWTLHVMGALQPADYLAASSSPTDYVRAWAVQLATERSEAHLLSPETLLRLATHDSSATVRLALASALPALEPVDRWAVGVALAAHVEDAGDRFLPKVIWTGMAPLVESDFNRALDLVDRTELPALSDSLIWYVSRTAGGREQLAQRFGRFPAKTAARAVRLMAVSLENEASLPQPPSWPEAVRQLATIGLPAPSGAAVENLSALFGDESILAKSRTALADDRASSEERQTALKLLKRAGDTTGMPLYVKLLDDEKLRSPVLPLLARSSDPAVAQALITHFGVFSDTDKRAVLEMLTSRPAKAVVLMNAVRDGRFDKKNLTALHVRQLRTLHNSPVDLILDQVWGRAADLSADKLATIAVLKKKYESAPAWSYDGAAGREVFNRNCIACHAVDGAGGKVGPNLTGSWRNGVDYFLENVVDPNAVVGFDYQLNVITTRDASVVAGMIESETPTILVVRTVTDTISIPKDQIKSRETTPQSMMPAGLLESLPEIEAKNLLKFLTQPR